MAYDDRDYFQTKPKFEFSAGLGDVTKGLLILLAVVYIGGLIAGDTTDFAHPDYWAAAAARADGPTFMYQVFVLVPQNVLPASTNDIGHWKLLTHWMLGSSLLAAVLNLVFVYFVGRMLEQILGRKSFLLLFVGACVFAGLCASLVDGLLVRDKLVVILGPGPGILAVFATVIWIAPDQKWFFGWRMRYVVIGILALITLFSLLTGLLSSSTVVLSPTQPIWGIAVGAGYMLWLKRKGRVPSFTGGPQEKLEPWEQPGYLQEKPFDEGKFKTTASRQRDAEDKATKQAIEDKRKLDAILEKISASGITSLSRSEKKFLDAQSKKKK